VADLVSRPAAVIYADMSLRDAADQMVRHDIGRLPVVDRANPQRVEETDAMFEQWSARGKNAIKRHMGIHRDIKVRKRRTEVDFHVGPVVERGAALGVPTPLNARLVDLVHQVESGQRPQDWSNIAALDEELRTLSV
jgi:ketopantoate reductase